jgi:hypothetical protein
MGKPIIQDEWKDTYLPLVHFTLDAMLLQEFAEDDVVLIPLEKPHWMRRERIRYNSNRGDGKVVTPEDVGYGLGEKKMEDDDLFRALGKDAFTEIRSDEQRNDGSAEVGDRRKFVQCID